MDFLFVNTQELSALSGLPYSQRIAYVFGIRPYMDRKTFLVGIKRGISYQSLSEVLYVEPHSGIKSGSPSREQVRRVVKGLERAGLIELQSIGKQLILKCLLAESNISVQNKPDTKSTHHTNTLPIKQNQDQSTNFAIKSPNSNIDEILKPDTPHNSEKPIAFVYQQFEKFWESYPLPQNKQKAWEEFKKLAPDEKLFLQIMKALKIQVDHYRQQQEAGFWIPHWKYPANWLAQQSWNDALILNRTEENNHAKHQTSNRKQSAFDIFWASCKGGADFDFAD